MTYMTNTFSIIKQAERNLATFCDISNIQHNSAID